MTTTANGDRGRVVEHVDGIVEGTSERGVHPLGEPDWRNFSKYGDRLPPPGRGTRVRPGLDSGGFVRTLQVLAQPDAAGRSREIRRLAVLKAAANFLGLMSQCREKVESDRAGVVAMTVSTGIECTAPDPNAGPSAMVVVGLREAEIV